MKAMQKMNQNCANSTTPVQVLHALLGHIEARLPKALTLEQLAAASGLSRFQLIRLFSRLFGVTPMEYVRARRLARSLPDLMRGGNVLDVAMDWGFEYEQSYIRAFRSAYGVTPARFTRQQQPIPILTVPRLSGLTVSVNGMLGKPTVQARPAFSLSGPVITCNYADNLLHGTPLREGLAGSSADPYIAACRVSARNRFDHEYLVDGQAGNAPSATWHWPAGHWAHFVYLGLHPLDPAGAQRVRLLASLVVNHWYAEQGIHWNGTFIERLERRLLRDDYCEIEWLCPL